MISFVSGYYGWLGNQMFQYAATKALSLHRGTECFFPANRPNLHEVFALKAFTSPRPLDRTPGKYQEPHFHHSTDFWRLPDGTMLSGYFQSEKYFAPYAERIRREFNFEPRSGIAYSGRPTGTVSIHVRRGDYLSFPEHHPPLTMDYYNAAMEHFPGARFLIFSDDPGWCLLNFDRSRCEISTGRSAIEDMALMASCDSHIIANSSFSWWGAWLGRNPDKRVIAPLQWFGPAKAGWSTEDLIPGGWVRI